MLILLYIALTFAKNFYPRIFANELEWNIAYLQGKRNEKDEFMIAEYGIDLYQTKIVKVVLQIIFRAFVKFF